jgi:hypothetical protein
MILLGLRPPVLSAPRLPRSGMKRRGPTLVTERFGVEEDHTLQLLLTIRTHGKAENVRNSVRKSLDKRLELEFGDRAEVQHIMGGVDRLLLYPVGYDFNCERCNHNQHTCPYCGDTTRHDEKAHTACVEEVKAAQAAEIEHISGPEEGEETDDAHD